MKKVAVWNGARGLWENPEGSVDLFSVHSEPFLGTWPAWGMTRSGVAFELPMRVLRMGGSASSLLPTPVATDAAGSARHTTTTGRMHSGTSLTDSTRLMPTPAAADGTGSGRHNSSGHQDTLPGTVRDLLPTPQASEGRKTTTGETSAFRKARGHQVMLTNVAQDLAPLLPTPTTQDAANTGGPSQFGRNTLPLNTEVLTLLPTPSAMVANDGESPESWQARRDRHASKADHPTRAGLPLTVAAVRLSRGEPTKPRSDGGSSSPDE